MLKLSQRKSGVVFLAIAASLALVFATGCEVEVVSNGNGAPSRPSGVPDSAVWLGGADGGVFIVLEKREGTPAELYHGSIYHESGALAYRGRLAVKSTAQPPVDVNDPHAFVGWDGDRLNLEDDRSMAAIDPFPAPDPR